MTISDRSYFRPLLDAIAQIGVERVRFSMNYPYKQMDEAGRRFDDTALGDDDKYRIGRGTAVGLFKPKLGQSPEQAVTGFAAWAARLTGFGVPRRIPRTDMPKNWFPKGFRPCSR